MPHRRFLPSPMVVLLVILLLAAAAVQAQDANYWDNQYGTKAELLGGLVVGSPSDLSATYYNPGWIPLGVDASLLVTTQAVQYSSLNVRSALGDGADVTYTNTGTSPGFLAGRFNAVREEGWQLAWTYLEKIRYKFDAGGERIDPSAIPTADGEEWFMAEAFRVARTDENWYGISAATKLSDRSAIGFTPYFVYRTQRQRVQGYTRELVGTSGDRSAFLADEFRFSDGRLLAKIGIAFDYDPVTFGFALTTPGLHLMGSGQVMAAISLTGYDFGEDGTVDPLVVANAQEDLTASWQSPLSIAAGMAWRGGGTGLHLTAEWFNEVDQGSVIEPAPFRDQTTGRLITYDTSLDQRAVLNVGLGIDHRFSPKFALYGAFRTDFSSIESYQKSDMLMSTWDLWHITTGASFQFLGVGFTAGLQYSFANDSVERFIDFTNSDATPLEDAYPRTAEVRYRRLKLVVGFDLALLGVGK